MSAAGEELTTAEPVAGFGRYTWWTGRWERIFDLQIEHIKDEVARAHAEDRVVVYLSCPVSSRGGGSSTTHTDVAIFTARRLAERFGERLFVLNPAAFQMEAKEGTGLILQHVRRLWPDEDPEAFLRTLAAQCPLGGGDYMRMWVKVLVNDERLSDGAAPDCGGMFDASYFLGPTDVRAFFGVEGDTLTQAVESYFARKFATDLDFRQQFEVQAGADPARVDEDWERKRKRFFRYYALRASASYSNGSHDEWNLLIRLNKKRRAAAGYGPGEEIACYFDGRQVNPADTVAETTPGYEVVGDSKPPSSAREIAWPTLG